MLKRENGLVCLFMAALLTLMLGSIVLADDGVILQYKGAAGDSIVYKTVTNGKMKANLGGLEQTVNMSMTQSFSQKIVGVSEDGKLYMDMIFEGQDIKVNGQKINLPVEQSLAGKKITMLMESSGKIVEVSGELLDSAKIKDFKQLFTQSTGVFPLEPVKIGQEWVNEMSYNLPNAMAGAQIPMNVRMKYKFLGVESLSGKQAAKISTSMYGTLKGDFKEPKGTAVGFNAVFSGNGIMYFAIDEGKVLSSSSKLNVKMGMNMKTANNKPQKINMNMDMDVAMNLQ